MNDNNQETQQSEPIETVIIDKTLNNNSKINPNDIEQDKILAMKTAYVNNAIDEIGFTRYQLKLFFLNGFGYAVDSLLLLLNALTQPQVALQYKPTVSKAQTIAMGTGLLFGALFWGLGADVRRLFFPLKLNIIMFFCKYFR